METEAIIRKETQAHAFRGQIPVDMAATNISAKDSDFLAYLRSLSMFVIVFGHVGGFWIFRPYSEFLHVFVPVFFFISGAVSIYRVP